MTQKSTANTHMLTHTEQMLVSRLVLLLLADVSTGASYESSSEAWLRLKKVLTPDNDWSASSKVCLNAEWTWKRKSGTNSPTMRLIQFLLCRVTYRLPDNSSDFRSEITVRRRVWGCSESHHMDFSYLCWRLWQHTEYRLFLELG